MRSNGYTYVDKKAMSRVGFRAKKTAKLLNITECCSQLESERRKNLFESAPNIALIG